MKKKEIEKHLNIHVITLLVSVLVEAVLDLLNIYTISSTVMIVFLVGYSLYIIISTLYLINKNYNIDYDKIKSEKNWKLNHREVFHKKLKAVEKQMEQQDKK